jgi:antitoxin (DNA-binding transcriptional repressor) of toxin-antitoxin stability system
VHGATECRRYTKVSCRPLARLCVRPPNALAFSGLGAEAGAAILCRCFCGDQISAATACLTTHTDLDILSDRSYIMVMKTIAAAKFKEQCLSMLDHLDPDGVVITKHGKPVARVLPAERASADLIGALRGRVSIKGDVQSTGLTWEAHG